MARRRVLRFATSIGLAIVLLALFLRNLDFAAVGAAIRGARGGWLAVAAAFGLLATPLIRSWRWGRLLKAFPAGWKDLNAATSIGFAASTLLPARAGEVVRPVALSRAAGIPLGPCLSSIVLERLIDLLMTIGLFVVYALGWAPAGMGGEEASRFAILRRSAVILGAGTVAGLALLALFALRRDLPDRLMSPVLRLLPDRWGRKISGAVHSLLDGLGALGTLRDLLAVAALSFVLWMTICFQIGATLRAFGLVFPFPVTFFVLIWCVIGLAVPTPGGVGGYHAAAAYSVSGFYGVAKDTAAAFALVSHAISFVPITLLGLGFLFAGGFSLTRLAEEGAGPAP